MSKPAPLATSFLDKIRGQRAQPQPAPAPVEIKATPPAPQPVQAPAQDNTQKPVSTPQPGGQASTPPGKRKRGPKPEGERASGNRPDRAGLVLVAGHFPPEVRKKLHLIAVQEDKNLQEVMLEAFGLLFAKKAIRDQI